MPHKSKKKLYSILQVVTKCQKITLILPGYLRTNIIFLENFYFCNFSRKSILGEALVLGLHLDVVGAGIGPEGPGSPEAPSNMHYVHAWQLFYYNFPGKLFLGESKWSWLSQNTFKIPMNNIMLDNFYAHKCAGKWISGEVLALGLHLEVSGVGFDLDGPGCPVNTFKWPILSCLTS